MVWDVATAVAWRLDPDRRRLSDVLKDGDLTTAVERVFVENAQSVKTPPRLQKSIEELRSRFPDAITEIMQFIVAEHIYAALNSEICTAVQDPDRVPFLIIGEDAARDAVFIDIDTMLAEYHEAPSHMADWERREEEAIKQVIRNSVTPRFDKVEVRLEDISRKLDAGFNASAAASDMKTGFSDINRRFDQLLDEIKKSKPPQP